MAKSTVRTTCLKGHAATVTAAVGDYFGSAYDFCSFETPDGLACEARVVSREVVEQAPREVTAEGTVQVIDSVLLGHRLGEHPTSRAIELIEGAIDRYYTDAREDTRAAEREKRFRATPLADLELSVMTMAAAQRAGIRTIGQLADKYQEPTVFNRKSRKEIESMLIDLGVVR